MGVTGVTEFVKQYRQQCFKDDRLHSTKLVIDGYGLMSLLYFNDKIDPGHHGGKYQQFYTQCTNFFKMLQKCRIEPYVVFDGAYDMDGKKTETMKKRLQQKIDRVKSIKPGKQAYIMPTMANEVFKKVMRDFPVPFGFCDFEADRDIAVLANAFQCPVLGKDSDFFIMDIYNGYIPFDTLEWSHPSEIPLQPGQYFISCQRYKLRDFCRYFQVEPCLMPLFASVCGNDYLKPIDLEKFFDATQLRYKPEPDRISHPLHDLGNKRMCNLLHHLTYYEACEECLEMIVKHVPQPDRPNPKSDLSASCKMYEVSKGSPMVNFFKEDVDLPTNPLVNDHGVPKLFLEGLRKGEVPFICLVIYLNRKYFFGTQIENMCEERARKCCHDLLRYLAGIMLVEKSKSEAETLTIDIYDRDKAEVKCFQVEPLYRFGSQEVPTYKKAWNMRKREKKRNFLLACLEANDITMDGIQEEFKFVFVVTVYWFRKAQPQVPQNLLVALVLGWIQGVAWCKKNARHISAESQANNRGFNAILMDDYKSVLHKFNDLATRPQQQSPDLTTSHSLAQWVACFCSAEDINALLIHVFPRADMTVLFNGVLIHNLYHTLMRPCEEPQEERIDTLLPRNSPARCLFEQLMGFFSRHFEFEKIDEWTLVGSQKGKRRHHGGGRGRGRGRGGGEDVVPAVVKGVEVDPTGTS